ncbi:MAG: two-component sensor histidine kinase [Betaproteobacteria bacterium]|nr:MAG: two-component sensor histidine kinase [Betaproteobacteria bacterium]
MRSLRTRLLVTVSLVSIAVWAASVWVSYGKALHETDELLDSQLTQTAELLRAQIDHENDLLKHTRARHKSTAEGREEDEEHWITEGLRHDPSDQYGQNLAFQITDHHGMVLHSDNAPDIPTDLAAGITDIYLSGHHWRVLTVLYDRRHQDLRIQVAHRRDSREKAALEVAQQVALPPLVALPILLLLVYLAVRRGLQPLNTLASTVAHRSADHLEPLERSNTPDEALPLLDAINRLFAQIDDAMERERRFTAEAAHELRTPIAAIKIQAQVAAASTVPEDRTHALAQLLHGIQRTERLIDQMLRLARLDPAAPLPTAVIEPAALLHEVFESSEGMVLAHGHHLYLSPLPTDLPPLQGDVDLLHTALANLVHNACHHTPSGCTIYLGAHLNGQRCCLTVHDDGPGVAADEIAQLGARFRRGRNATTTGSGLGLAIVRRIAERHGAQLQLANRNPHGFEAALCWEIATP